MSDVGAFQILNIHIRDAQPVFLHGQDHTEI